MPCSRCSALHGIQISQLRKGQSARQNATALRKPNTTSKKKKLISVQFKFNQVKYKYTFLK